MRRGHFRKPLIFPQNAIAVFLPSWNAQYYAAFRRSTWRLVWGLHA